MLIKNAFFLLSICWFHTGMAQSKIIQFDSKWDNCSNPNDCVLTRFGTSCEWTAVNKEHIDSFIAWNGYIHRNQGAGPSCQKNLKMTENEMQTSCVKGKCKAQTKPVVK